MIDLYPMRSFFAFFSAAASAFFASLSAAASSFFFSFAALIRSCLSSFSCLAFVFGVSGAGDGARDVLLELELDELDDLLDLELDDPERLPLERPPLRFSLERPRFLPFEGEGVLT